MFRQNASCTFCALAPARCKPGCRKHVETLTLRLDFDEAASSEMTIASNRSVFRCQNCEVHLRVLRCAMMCYGNRSLQKVLPEKLRASPTVPATNGTSHCAHPGCAWDNSCKGIRVWKTSSSVENAQSAIFLKGRVK